MMKTTNQNEMNPKKGERIAKVMARAGLCSRREAERWIESGRVSVNGKKLFSPAVFVSPQDHIKVDDKVLAGKEEVRLWCYHKPAGLVTTHRDEKGRKTVFDSLPKDLPRVISVGRLDLNSEGLLLLTNDGSLSRYMELPKTGWTRKYRVRAYGHITQVELDQLEQGIVVEGIRYGSIEGKIEEISKKSRNIWLSIALCEGKNREIRKVLEHLGLQVNRLIRVSYGPFQLGNLAVGEVKEIPSKVLKEQFSSLLSEGKK